MTNKLLIIGLVLMPLVLSAAVSDKSKDDKKEVRLEQAAQATLDELPVGFKMWKEQQIAEAQNRVVRLSNKIHLIKTGKYKFPESQPATDASGDAQPANAVDEDVELKKEQEQLERSIEALQFAKELNLEDYLAVYLSQYAADEKALEHVARRLSEKEIAQLIRRILSGNKARDTALRRTSIMNGLGKESQAL